jgi:hypothetical protein
MLPVPVPLKGSIGIEGSLSGPRSGGGDQQRCISVVFRRAAIPLLPAPSADLLGSPVSHIGKRGLSSGPGRRHAWNSRPTGRYRNLGFFVWVLLPCIQ